MASILLAPYNDSMKLGQGFNSFLQIPCVYGAVGTPGKDGDKVQPAKASQSVSFSSRFVDKISDVVQGMDISAASAIKSGTVSVSGNTNAVNESKFSSSDMNAVISVKV